MALHSDYYQIAIFIVFPETTYLKSHSLLRLIYWQLLLIHQPIYPSVSCIPRGFGVLHMALWMLLCGQNHQWLSLSIGSEIKITHLPSYLSGVSHYSLCPGHTVFTAPGMLALISSIDLSFILSRVYKDILPFSLKLFMTEHLY